MLITLATCCCNRTEHLKQTFLKNMEDNQQPYVRFLLVNYNSQDDMDEWAKVELMRYIPSGRLLYIHEKTAERFKHAHARNVAVRACQTEVFCNVDADNYTGPGFASWLREFYLGQTKAAFTSYGGQVRGSPSGDMFGRISFQTKSLIALGGYSEDLNTWGVEDYDLVQRALQAGFIQGGYPEEFDKQKVIKHQGTLRVEGTQYIDPKSSMEATAAAQQAKFGLEQQPNAKGAWGKARVTVNWDHEVDLPLAANQVI